MESKWTIGVDIGGSHISSIAVDLKKGKILSESFSQCEIDNKANASGILSEWANCIAASLKFVGNIEGIGIAMPGPFNYKNGIALFDDTVMKYQSLYGLNIRTSLIRLLTLKPQTKIRFINDAFGFGIGETWQGAGKAFQRVLALTLGTGFGSAFLNTGVPIVKGEVPADGFIYHVPFKQSIADDYISTRWFENEFRKRFKSDVKGVKTIAEFARVDKIVAVLFNDFATNFAQIVLPWIKRFDVEAIVIGGNISRASDLFVPQIHKIFIQNQLKTQIHLSTLKENATFIGCCRLIEQVFYERAKKQIY